MQGEGGVVVLGTRQHLEMIRQQLVFRIEVLNFIMEQLPEYPNNEQAETAVRMANMLLEGKKL